MALGVLSVLIFALFALSATLAFAGTVEEINALPNLDPLNRTEEAFSNGGKWGALAWDTSTSGHNTGHDTTSGWGPYDAFSTINGAYWTPLTFSDKTGEAATVTMSTSPGIAERYVALWLDMASPGSVKSGYQLRWTMVTPSTNTYSVTLSKWSSGSQTVLASNASVVVSPGTTIAISDTGGTVTAWEGASGALTSILSASDSTLKGGYAGLEGSGNISRSINFKAGRLLGGAILSGQVLDNLERQEVPLATGMWSKTGWVEEIGGAWMGGYRGYGSTGGLAGAYWNPTTFTDARGGDFVAATVGTGSPWAGEYLGLWLNMPKPSTARSGYEARFTGVDGSSSNYKVELSKWVSGTRTILASTAGYSLPVGMTMALSEAGGNVVLWTGTGSLSPLLSGSDANYTTGYAGLEVNGPAGTAYNFKAGTVGQPPNTTISSGPQGTVGSSTASFSFMADQQGSTFECSLDSGSYAPCSSPKAYEGLTNATHTFRVRAINTEESRDPTPAERTFQVNTLPNSATIDPNSYRSSGSDVASGGAYNYAPSVMLDGAYRMWWCAGIAGDHIVYAESSSLNGFFHARSGGNTPYEDVLQPTQGSQFDGTHVCDPSVIRVHGTYYMYYGGLTEASGHVTQIGVASSTNGLSWTKLNNDNPIVTPRDPSQGGYGAGQPSAAYVDGYFYLMYTDSSGLEGGLQYAIRSTDPTFQTNVETATASGFVPRTSQNRDSYVVSQSYSPDWQYSDALNAWIVLSNQTTGVTYVRFLAKDLSHVLRPDLQISSSWSEGPGLASTPEKHSLAPANGECQRIRLDFIQSTPPAQPPNDLKHYGSDLLTGHGCSELSSDQIASMFNGYGIEVSGLPLTVVVEKERLQFQLAAPALDITHNFIGTTSQVFYAIPYGASLYSGSTVLGATERPAAFLLDNSVLWPVSSIKIITDNNSFITYVSPSEFDSHQIGPSLYEVH